MLNIHVGIVGRCPEVSTTGINWLVVMYGDQNGDTKTITNKYDDHKYAAIAICQIY